MGQKIFIGLAMALSCLSCLAAAEAWAQSASTVALFPAVQNGKLKAAWVKAVDDQLQSMAERVPITIVRGRTLNRVLKGDGAALAGRCSEPGCFAKLGQRLRVGEVIVPQVSGTASRMALNVVVVDVAKNALVRQVNLQIHRLEDISALVTPQFEAIFGCSDPDLLMNELALVPLTDDELVDDLALVSLDIEPIDAKQRAPARAASTSTTGAPSTTAWLTYGGYGATGLGAASLIIAGIFGAQAKSAYGSAEKAPRPSQIAAGQLQIRGDQAVGRANAAYAVGGGLIAVGSALLLYKWLKPSTKASSQVELGIAPHHAEFLVRW